MNRYERISHKIVQAAKMDVWDLEFVTPKDLPDLNPLFGKEAEEKPKKSMKIKELLDRYPYMAETTLEELSKLKIKDILKKGKKPEDFEGLKLQEMIGLIDTEKVIEIIEKSLGKDKKAGMITANLLGMTLAAKGMKDEAERYNKMSQSQRDDYDGMTFKVYKHLVESVILGGLAAGIASKMGVTNQDALMNIAFTGSVASIVQPLIGYVAKEAFYDAKEYVKSSVEKFKKKRDLKKPKEDGKGKKEEKHDIKTGPEGGKYYETPEGNKVYVESSMNRYERIAKKVVADYGDITTYVNVFDIFDTNIRTKELGTVRQDLKPEEIEMMKEFVRETANELQRMLNHDIIAELKKDGKLTRWMKAKGIRFNSRYE